MGVVANWKDTLLSLKEKQGDKQAAFAIAKESFRPDYKSLTSL
ncbi:hypothetical protein [Leptospira ilyithenensis]|nr:hypothetical protein [Leptospira ilyithenensis]